MVAKNATHVLTLNAARSVKNSPMKPLVPGNPRLAMVKTIKELSYREIAIMAPLVFLTLLLGIYPAPVFDVTAVSVKKLVAAYEAAVGPAAALVVP